MTVDIFPVDQDFALRWIHDHVSAVYITTVGADIANSSHQISKFGGDPKRVTIWGESAGKYSNKFDGHQLFIQTPLGGGSVLQHIIANGGNTQPQLFQAAIVGSLYLPPQFMYNDAVPEVILP